MIYILEELEQQYSQTPSTSKSIEETRNEILYAQKISENQRILVKDSLNIEQEELTSLQERILDGYDFAMNQLINTLTESNYVEISRLIRFLRNKLQINMWIVESEKRKLYFKNIEMNNLPKENSLFVEIFFVQKFEEITGKKLIKKN